MMCRRALTKVAKAPERFREARRLGSACLERPLTGPKKLKSFKATLGSGRPGRPLGGPWEHVWEGHGEARNHTRPY